MYPFVKRALDFFCCAIALILASPLLIVVAIVMAIHFKGNPFFVQKRIGKNNVPFKIYKLKSMTNEKDSEGNLLPNEQRLTKTGVWLRRSSIDEIPQLFNVVLGSMSLIGPRPMGLNYLNLFTEEQKQRHQVKPGITGWAQINGRDEVAPTEKFKMDVWYVNNRSFALDFKILLRTVLIVFKREGVDNRASDVNFPDNGSYNTNVSGSKK
ncbi:MAG: sugar transferase [Gilvibacter sp.]